MDGLVAEELHRTGLESDQEAGLKDAGCQRGSVFAAGGGTSLAASGEGRTPQESGCEAGAQGQQKALNNSATGWGQLLASGEPDQTFWKRAS